jgi:hypothetical protein
MASEVRFTESKTPLDFSIKYFIKSYHGGLHNVQSAKKHYFEMIEQNAFDDILNKRSRHEAYKSFIETPILEGGLGSSHEDFVKYFRDHEDVLVKHRDLWNKGKPQPGNQYTSIGVTNNVSNSNNKRNTIQGNRVDYSIDRLNKSGHIDLANKVMAKEISANAAMIQVGFRKPTITVKQETDDFIRVIKNIFTPEQINYICEKITNKS